MQRTKLSYLHMLTVGLAFGAVLKVAAGYPAEATASTAAATESKPESKPETTKAPEKHAEATAEAAKTPPPEPEKQCVTGPLLQAADEKLRLLDRRETDVIEKERMIEVAERRVQEQISRLDAMRKKLSETAGLADDKISKDREKLISIYEQMKPKEAAGIFNEMDPVVAGDLLKTMKEQKSSAILATMDAKKAYEVTIVLSSFLKKKQDDVSDMLGRPAAGGVVKQ